MIKKMLYYTWIPVTVFLLFQVSYWINWLLDKYIVIPYILPGTAIHPYVASTLSNGLLNSVAALLLLLLVMGWLYRKRLDELGLHWRGFGKSFKTTLLFTAGFMTVYVVFGSLAASRHAFEYRYPFPLSTSNLALWLFFEAFVSGLEELFYRCLVILLLLEWWKKLFPVQKHLHIAVVSASVLIFALRHIGVVFFPFTITYFSMLHLLVVSVMGTFLGIRFLQTRSFPVVYTAHGLINACIMGFLLVLAHVFG